MSAHTHTCERGHRWIASAVETATGFEQTLRCPECGSMATAAAPDELPPPPQPVGPTLLQPSSRPEIAGFELLEELGRGGMGVVYKARQKSLDRVVAVKMLLSGPFAHAEDLARLRVEAESIARLQHPNIVHVYDIGEEKGWTFISLEFLAGGNLAKALDGQPWPVDRAAELIETLARAVHAAHQRGVIHRDLKPANVLLTLDGSPKITDFGLAKRLDTGVAHTRTGAIMGTPCYMAPEQAEGRTKEIGPATDVYALGAIFYELLTGRPPFEADSSFDVMTKVVQEEPVALRRLRSDVPAAVEQVCMTCLHKDPARRYPTALALAEAIRAAGSKPAATTEVKEARSARPNARWPAVVAAGVILVGAGFLALHYWPKPAQKNGETESAVDGSPKSKSPAAKRQADFASEGAKLRWSLLSVGRDDEKFDRIAFPSRTVGYAASRRAVYKTSDGGTTWSESGLTGGRVHVLVFQDEHTGWLGTDQLRHTTNGGATWTPVALPGGRLTAVTALAMGPDGTALAGGTDPDGRLVLFRRPSATPVWEPIDLTGHPTYRSWYVGEIAVRGPQSAVAALFRGFSDGGALLATTDGGKTWAVQHQADEDLYRVRFADADHGWLAGNHGSLWQTTDGGTHWLPVRPAGDAVTVSCLSLHRRLGLAPLWQGEVLLTNDGRSWQTTTLPVGFGYSMPSAAVVEGCGYVLSADGRIARYE
jgi:serine/threonine protein kinase/photosystem II stability/assembly factor-like uncharacterized protein